jgi:hypothetical protein
MLLLIVLGLIAKLTPVSADCPAVNTTLTGFDWNKVRICVLT